jgi:hypothetical protein
MGATLVKIVTGAEWADLSRPARVLLTHMAVTALDNGDRPRLYYAGHDSLAEVLFGGATAGRLRCVRRYVKELVDAGAIELVKRSRQGSNAHYFLTLERRTDLVLRSESSPELTADQIGPTAVGPNQTQRRTNTVRNGGPDRSYIGTNKEQQRNQDAGRPADAVQSLVTSSSQIQKSPYLGESTRLDGFGIGNNENQDQKRQEEEPRCRSCGVAEPRHHQWTVDSGDTHTFVKATAQPARKRRRRKRKP